MGLLGLGLWLLTTPPALANQAQTEAASSAAPAGTGNIDAKCRYRGTFLGGKVQVVDSFADIRVKAVSSFPDLKVKRVESFADDCGEWQFVDSFPDFKIQMVDSFPDVEVAWVTDRPGMP